ncbi:hypothetical protein [Pseudoclavibacter terrae]|uniref:Uncharacterized protein n=1 Tax=Pseudoclavibacter terrae TaxID=1530195 RepID=A0A7J5B1C8_9MICO|nr:hypothetical protein [Pseudoclavibacter terrae]KAB1637741.1 hypothetical protein F8O03_11105 [Pseudoclavibacter terrae]
MLREHRLKLLAGLAAGSALLALSGCAGDGQSDDASPDEGMQAPGTPIADALTENEMGGTLDFGALLPSGATGAVIACPADTVDTLAESTGIDAGNFELADGTLPVADGSFALLFGDAEDRISSSAVYAADSVDLCAGDAVASTYLGSGALVMLSKVGDIWTPNGVE